MRKKAEKARNGGTTMTFSGRVDEAQKQFEQAVGRMLPASRARLVYVAGQRCGVGGMPPVHVGPCDMRGFSSHGMGGGRLVLGEHEIAVPIPGMHLAVAGEWGAVAHALEMLGHTEVAVAMRTISKFARQSSVAYFAPEGGGR